MQAKTRLEPPTPGLPVESATSLIHGICVAWVCAGTKELNGSLFFCTCNHPIQLFHPHVPLNLYGGETSEQNSNMLTTTLQHHTYKKLSSTLMLHSKVVLGHHPMAQPWSADLLSLPVNKNSKMDLEDINGHANCKVCFLKTNFLIVCNRSPKITWPGY